MRKQLFLLSILFFLNSGAVHATDGVLSKVTLDFVDGVRGYQVSDHQTIMARPFGFRINVYRDFSTGSNPWTFSVTSPSGVVSKWTTPSDTINWVRSFDSNEPGIWMAQIDNGPIITWTIQYYYYIEFATMPSGLQFIVDGITYTDGNPPQPRGWEPGSTHTISTISPQERNGVREVFSSWNDGGALTHTFTVPRDGDAVFTARFDAQFPLSAAVSPKNGGTISVSPESPDGYYLNGATVQLTAIANPGYFFMGWSGDLTGTANPQPLTISALRNVTATFAPTVPQTILSLDTGGAATVQTPGIGSLTVGYADIAINSGSIPYGTAVFSLKQDGVTVSEAGVPASPPTTMARIFIDYGSGVNAQSSKPGAGSVNINTGIALVNCGAGTASITYTLRDAEGNVVASGHGRLGSRNHLTGFIDQLKDISAPDFNFPTNFRTGSLEISSDQPLSVLALRGTMNQRNEFLMTTTPIADLTQPLTDNSVYFPQFADGSGSTTSLILLNTSGQTETGLLQIRDDNGNPMNVSQVGGAANSIFQYSIPAGGVFPFQSDGSSEELKKGWISLTPTNGTMTPVSSGVFGYNSPEDILVSESGIPSVVPTTHSRIYVDLSANHNTGLAIANISSTSTSILIKAYQKDGITPAGSSDGPLLLRAKGHTAAFANQLISGLLQGFTGVLDIVSSNPFAALTIRSLDNERADFLMTTFPVADANQTAPSPIIFPQIADGGGSATEFILISPGGQANTTLNLYDNVGTALDFIK